MVAAPSTGNVALTLHLLGDTAAGGDTLGYFRVYNAGTLDSAAVTVKLYEDALGDSQFTGSDTLIATLIWNAGGWWESLPLMWPLGPDGADFLVIVNVAGTAPAGGTFRARIDSFTIDSYDEDSGPEAQLLAANTLTVVDTSLPNAWYVNDGSTAGDVYYSAAGDTANHGLTPDKPLYRPGQVDHLLTAGDTVYVDAGMYYEPDSVTVTCSFVMITGKDSASTVIDFNNTVAGANRALTAVNVDSLIVRDLRLTRGAYGVRLDNVDGALLDGIRCDSAGLYGVWLNNSAGNILREVWSCSNGNAGVVLQLSPGNVIDRLYAEQNGYAGLYLTSAHGCTVTGSVSCSAKRIATRRTSLPIILSSSRTPASLV